MPLPKESAADASVARTAVTVRFVGHATVLLEGGSRRVLTDPFLRDRLGPLERHGPLPDPDDLRDIDVIVISHGHPDHFDPASLAAVGGDPVVVVPRGLGPAASRAVRGEVIEIAAGEMLEVRGVNVRGVPARHWISPGAPRGRPLGYLLDLGPRVYFAGDTGRMPAVPELAHGVDLALLPVWTWGPHRGPGHLGPRSAAEALRDIRPTVAIPIHWGTLYPRRLHRVWNRPLTEPGDRFAEHAARLAPQVLVTVLRPGETTSISGGDQ
jgi:L-ascorbate metabolism protein UlaG (beta-lactamase superfamily)